MVIALCQPHYEALLEEELEQYDIQILERSTGWLRTAAATHRLPDEHGPGLCFAHRLLFDAVEVHGESVNDLARACANAFLDSARNDRFEDIWPLLVSYCDTPALARRVRAFEKALSELLRRRIPRVMKLASFEGPRGIARSRGLFIHFVDFDRAFFAREALSGGQRRMADDPAAPSRSYLKAEEAYVVLGSEPRHDEIVVDLGAAPGGWSYGAARRGARVIAVDNGPLKGGALHHPLIEHRREDAFRFRPDAPVDWLLCDMVDEPHHVLRAIIEPWLEAGLCRKMVVNLKTGRTNAPDLVRRLLDPSSVLISHTEKCHIRHLFHDRDEITIVAQTDVE